MSKPLEVLMRSELVFEAVRHVSNPYLLTRAIAKAIRKLHRPNTRIADTANEVFARFRRDYPLVVQGDKASDTVIQWRAA